MHWIQVVTFAFYFLLILGVVYFSYRKQRSDNDFVIGNRSLGFWLTALSAHASDMSNWLFMGYPALIFLTGIFSTWAAIGLVVFMFLNWQFLAPKIRIATEKTNTLTLSSYFEKRFQDLSGWIRVSSSVLSLLFFTIYISAGLQGLGFLVESLFGLNYSIGITLGLAFVVFYVLLGGYLTVAWLDLVQGLFLLGVILFIPFYLIPKLGGLATLWEALRLQGLSTSLFPDLSWGTWLSIIFLSSGWGLGYFGQPHIITKFMGIRDVQHMYKAKYIGISWQALSLMGATGIGLLGVMLFPRGLPNSELVALETVKLTLVPFFSALVLCAILAATTNVMAAQLLASASSLAEDVYKRVLNPKASHQELLRLSRLSVVFIACLAFFVAFFQFTSIYKLVLYAWSGIGASFGPLLLFSLYAKKVTRQGALGGILTGGIVSALCPFLMGFFPIEVPPLILAFPLSCAVIYASCFFSREKTS